MAGRSIQTFVPGSHNCVEATVNALTSPSLSELDGTIFAVISVISAPKVTSAAKATFTTGTSGTFTVTTSGFPTPALTLTGTLPSGLTFADNADGTATISGTAASGTAKKYTFTLKAKNTAGAVTQTLTLVVNQVPAITSTDTATFVTGQSGTFKVTTTGAPIAVLSVTAGILPAGLRFVDAGNGTATLSGTPGSETSGKLSSSPLTAANSAGTSIQSFDLVVDSVPAFTSAAKATFTTGTSGTFTVTTSGFHRPRLLPS